MAKNHNAPANRPDVANMPRQSEVAFAGYVTVLQEHAPDQLVELVEAGHISQGMIDEINAAVDGAGDLFTDPTAAAIARAISQKVDAATKALTNTDALNGYSGHVFDAEKFAKKIAPKTGRKRLTADVKVSRMADELSKENPEWAEALRELLAAQGIEA